MLTVWSLYSKCRTHGRCSCMLHGIHTQQQLSSTWSIVLSSYGSINMPLGINLWFRQPSYTMRNSTWLMGAYTRGQCPVQPFFCGFAEVGSWSRSLTPVSWVRWPFEFPPWRQKAEAEKTTKTTGISNAIFTRFLFLQFILLIKHHVMNFYGISRSFFLFFIYLFRGVYLLLCFYCEVRNAMKCKHSWLVMFAELCA